MTRIAKLSLVALVVATVAVAGCKKKDDNNKSKKKKKPTTTGKVQPKPQPMAKKLEGEALLPIDDKCWKAFDAEDAKAFADCYADKVDFALVGQVPMTPGEKESATTRDGVMALVKPYWAMVKLKTTPDLTLVNGSNIAVVARAETTNDADVGPMKATNKTAKTWQGQVGTFDDKGKITTDHHYWDSNSVMGQLGMAPLKKGQYRDAWTKGYWDSPLKVVAKNDDKEKKNVDAYKALVAAFNSGDAKKFMAFAADDIQMHHMDMPMDHDTKAKVEALVKMFYTAFPKATLTPKNTWAAGDWTVAEVTFKGKNAGPIPGLAPKPTNNEVTSDFLHVAQWENGKIKQFFVFTNGFNMWAQLYPKKLEAMKKDMAKKMGAGAAPAPKKGEAPKKGAAPAKGMKKAPMKKAPAPAKK